MGGEAKLLVFRLIVLCVWLNVGQSLLYTSYHKLSEELYYNVHSASPDDNLKAAEEWRQIGNLSTGLRRALDQFIELASIKGDCGSRALQVLKNNHRAAAGTHRYYKTDEERASKRIDDVIYEFSREHAKLCMLKYPIEFERRLKEFREKVPQLEWVISLMSSMNVNLQTETCKAICVYKRIISESLASPIRPDAKLVLDNLKGLKLDETELKLLKGFHGDAATDESMSRRVIHEELLSKYLLSPCEQLIDLQARDDLYARAEYERPMLSWEEFEAFQEHARFFEIWAISKMCTNLSRTRSAFFYEFTRQVEENAID